MNQNKEKELFDDVMQKQAKLAKVIVLGTLGGLGGLFVVLGLLLGSLVLSELYVFIVLGVFMACVGLIFYFVLPEKYNYEQYQKRIHKYGYQSYFEINIKLSSLEEQNKDLEARVDALEKKLRTPNP